MITDKIIDIVCKISVEDSKKSINPINELKKHNNLSIITLDRFVETYENEITDFIDNQTLELDEEDDLVNKVIARELAFKCLYFNEKYKYGDYNVSDDYIYDILQDYFDNNEELHNIILAVDTSKRTSYISPAIKQSIRTKSSKQKRRLLGRYSYDNPFHRVHGFFITKDNPCKCPPTIIISKKKYTPKIISLSVICANPFSSKSGIKAVGSYLLCFFLYLYKFLNYDYAILEVANDHAIMSDYLEEEDYLEEDLYELTNIELQNILIDFGLSKTGTKDKLVKKILEYQELEESKRCSLSYEERLKKEEDIDEDELDEYSYGGINYHQGRDEQSNLYCNFYEKAGFKEDPDINTKWNCFANIPYPCMKLDFKKKSFKCIADSFLNRTWTQAPSVLCDKGVKTISKHC
jgi:hypothetical protein